MQDSTEIVSNETNKDIKRKSATMETIPVEMDVDKPFDNEAEAIAVTTDHAGEPQRWGKGIIQDFKRTVGTHWVKEMTNFNQKTVAVTLFIYIAAIAPTVTFGAVYGRSTKNYMGAIELMLASGWYGMTYALIGGMPMVSSRLACDVVICHPSFPSHGVFCFYSVSMAERDPSLPSRPSAFRSRNPSACRS
jgi:hypothetical protein